MILLVADDELRRLLDRSRDHNTDALRITEAEALSNRLQVALRPFWSTVIIRTDRS